EGDEVAAAQSVNPFRDKYGLHGKLVVVHSGNLSYVHPLDTVLDAMVRLKETRQSSSSSSGMGREKRTSTSTPTATVEPTSSSSLTSRVSCSESHLEWRACISSSWGMRHPVSYTPARSTRFSRVGGPISSWVRATATS